MIGDVDPEVAHGLAELRRGYAQKAIRIQYGESMIALAEANPDFLVLTADLMFATGMEKFGARFPDRLVNLGIAEQNMAGVAAGLALCGKLPVVCGYAAFTTLRAVEQAKLDAAYNGVKVIFTGQSAGLSYGVGGPTHQTYEDIAIMRAIPSMIVLVPSDAAEVDACLRAAIAHPTTSPIYIRLGRGPEFAFHGAGTEFEIGKAETLRQGDDVCLVATGSMAFEAMIAADYLAGVGIGARVLNMRSVKPIDAEALKQAAGSVEAMVVIEEHATHGGLGAAVLECLAEAPGPRIRLLGIPDVFPPIGPPHELRASLGLSAENLVANVFDLLGQGRRRPRAARA